MNYPKKITVLKKDLRVNATLQDIINSAKKFNIEVDFLNVEGQIQDFDEIISQMGEIVIRRGVSSLSPVQKNILMKKIKESGRIVFNGIYDVQPFASDKSYQQSAVQKLNIDKIETFDAKNREILLDIVKSGQLKYPFIAKKKVSGEGRGVHLITSVSDISKIEKIDDSIYQNFIENTGEYRIYVIGGRPVGILKKRASDSGFKNNVSQGSVISVVEDKKLKEKLFGIAEKVMGVFDVDYVGVDLLEGKDGKYYFMEINTVANWDAQEYLKIDETIGSKIVRLAIDLYNRKSDLNLYKNTPYHIRKYYDENLCDLHSKRFHYLSRMYLWTGDKMYKDQLEIDREKYLSKKIVKNIDKDIQTDFTPKKKTRLQYEKKYPLSLYNKYLFKNLFAKTIYGVDISSDIMSEVGYENLVKVFNDLYKDKETIAFMSTHAINFFYNSLFLMDNCNVEKPNFDPKYIFDIAKNDEFYDLSNRTHVSIKIYLLTHMIIGASNFYSKTISDHLYTDVIVELEKIIKERYFDLTVDNKVEFLVCASLCKYKTDLKETILNELSLSMKDNANILIEKGDESNKNNCFNNSEHRNVLSIMAFTEKKL